MTVCRSLSVRNFRRHHSSKALACRPCVCWHLSNLVNVFDIILSHLLKKQ
ncbi:unnamed protein product [Ixodes persulcatus]